MLVEATIPVSGQDDLKAFVYHYSFQLLPPHSTRLRLSDLCLERRLRKFRVALARDLKIFADLSKKGCGLVPPQSNRRTPFSSGLNHLAEFTFGALTPVSRLAK